MEAASRLALLAIVARAGSPLQRDEKATWSPSSNGYLPLITVEEYDVEAADGGGGGGGSGHGEGKWLLYQHKRATRRGSGGDAVAAARHEKGTRGAGLESVAWWILLVLECLLVGAVEGWIIYMVYNGGDYAVWNWLSDFASPALMILFSVSFSAVLLRGVGCSGRVGDLGFQAAGLVLATFCAVVVCAGVGEGKRGRSEGEEEGKGVRVVVGLAVKMWFLFFIGFWCAVFQWYSGDKRETQQRTTRKKGKKRERGYGTTSGGLATVDEAYEGVVGDL
ncbi:hypothetical protein CI238_04396 [Colletotrichum incanum]|uniref:Uncharacterized protein n=1 Tax=Colletotrichum incanum TaxID=1573173 RepID=A0A161VSU6_COLIC|nr:hypothetical protein CI238_04396 [Colletotrichum incanum]OHX00716.1 hypothetical protein CSPAE12_00556 [Colletotrichum incanum]